MMEHVSKEIVGALSLKMVRTKLDRALSKLV